MEENGRMKRRGFLKTAAAGAALGASAEGALAQKTGKRPALKRDFMRIGMVGLGPYSHAMAYTDAINDPTVPPRTNMKVVAVWGRADGYAGSVRGAEEWKKKRIDELKGYLNVEKFTKTLSLMA